MDKGTKNEAVRARAGFCQLLSGARKWELRGSFSQGSL